MIFLKIDCQNTTILPFLSIVKNIMLLIQIIVPIILIISGIISFTNMLMNPDEKKELKKIFNKFLAATIVFIIPLVINLVIGLFGEISSFSSCWENADSFSFGSSTYQKTDEDKDKKKTSIINDRSGYEDSINPGNSCLKENGTTRVLFVGNSKTYAGDIPSKFKGISEANGYNVSVSSVTKGGKTLEWLASNYRSQITNDSYDCVILQEQTDVYGGDYNTYLKGVRNVVSLVRRQNNNVKTYIRALWITRESSSSDSKTSYENTETIAKKTSSFVIYDGKAFDRSRSTYPNIILFSDSVHQNQNGAYLSAATIFKGLSGKAASSSSYAAGINKNIVSKLLKIAAES